MRRGFTLTEVLVALGIFALVGGTVVLVLTRSAQVEAASALTAGAGEVVRFFAGRALYGDGRFLPSPGGQRSFGYGELSEVLRQQGLNLPLADRYRVEVRAGTASGRTVRYDLRVCFVGAGGEECREAPVWGVEVLP